MNTLLRDWPSYKFGRHDLIFETEFSETRVHGPKIANEVTETIVEVQYNILAMMAKPHSRSLATMLMSPVRYT